MNCPKCGAELDDYGRICGNCGLKITSDVLQQIQDQATTNNNTSSVYGDTTQQINQEEQTQPQNTGVVDSSTSTGYRYFGDDNRAERKALRCPKCGMSDFSAINEVTTKGKDYSFAKGCCCSLLFLNLFGLFCGFCGKGKTTTNTLYYVCNNCGKKWKA